MKNFFRGAALVFEGIAYFYKDRSLWKYTLFTWLILLAFYSGIIWLITRMTRSLSLYLTSRMADYPEFLKSLLEGSLTFIAIVLATVIVLTTLSAFFEIFGGIFFDRLITAFEKKYYNRELPEIAFSTQLRFTLQAAWFCVKSNILFLLCLITSFFVPIVGQIILIMVMGGRAAYSLLLPSGFLRGQGIRETRQLFFDRRMELLGFGVTVYVLQMLPLFLPVTLPGMILGAVILYNNEAPQPPTPIQQAQ